MLNIEYQRRSAVEVKLLNVVLVGALATVQVRECSAQIAIPGYCNIRNLYSSKSGYNCAISSSTNEILCSCIDHSGEEQNSCKVFRYVLGEATCGECSSTDLRGCTTWKSWLSNVRRIYDDKGDCDVYDSQIGTYNVCADLWKEAANQVIKYAADICGVQLHCSSLGSHAVPYCGVVTPTINGTTVCSAQARFCEFDIGCTLSKPGLNLE